MTLPIPKPPFELLAACVRSWPVSEISVATFKDRTRSKADNFNGHNAICINSRPRKGCARLLQMP